MAKSADSFYLKPGDVVSLIVGRDNSGFNNFVPVFLDKDSRAPGKSMRFFRPTKGVAKPQLNEGEEWTAEVTGIGLDENRTTRDGRSRVIVYLRNFKRVEREVKRVINGYGHREIWSGKRLITILPAVKLHSVKDEFLNGNKVIVIRKHFDSINGKLFGQTVETYPVKIYQQSLRNAGIDVVRYFKKMRSWKQHLTLIGAA